MNNDLIRQISNFEIAMKDYRDGLFSEIEFEIHLRAIADEILKLIPRDRFEAMATKEEWESLGEDLGLPKMTAK